MKIAQKKKKGCSPTPTKHYFFSFTSLITSPLKNITLQTKKKMADGTNSKSWQKFIAELAKEEFEFSSIKHADEATRQQLLASLGGLTGLDRAAIMTTWKRLVAAQPEGPSSESSQSQEPAQQVPPSGSRRQPSPQSPYGSARGAGTPAGARGNSRPQDSGIFGQQQQSQYFDSQGDFGRGGPSSPAGFSPQPRSVQKAQPALLVPLNQNDPSGNSGSTLAQLRESLQRGDCATSLPLASELLHSDPIQLIHLLHHFLPQVSVEQLKVILGVGVTQDGGAAGAGGGDAFIPPAKSASMYSQPRASAGSPKTPYNSYSPKGGSSYYSPTHGGSSYQPPSQGAFDGYGDEVEMQPRASMNGQPLSVGQVLTSTQVQSQYGMRFTALCNGQVMKFPHMVAQGDRITIRPATDRLL